ncbi:MAG: TolC family protein [Gammaproteobacteria bacterium]|nr:TolC family protein [Gammaproteobacteria bacterium]
MFLKRFLWAGVCACLALPVWATDSRAVSLSISASGAQQIDPSLTAFIEQVWAESPAVQGAQAALEAAQARVEGADKPLHNPALEFDTERTDINTTSLGFSQTLDWSDKRGALSRIAKQELQAAGAGVLKQRQSVAVEALQALAGYFTALETQALTQRRSELMQGFVDAAKQRRAAGDLAALDVTLAQVAYSEALMAQAASESELAQREAALQAVSGLTLAQWPPLPSELAAPPAQVNPALLESLPELAVLRGRRETARARINLAERQGRMDPTFGVRAGREDSETLLGLSFEIPLFVRNNFKAEVRAASQDAIVEDQIYRDAHRRAAARLNGALGRFLNTSRAWQAWLATGQQARREQMKLLELMWQAGELTATDYLIQAKQNIDTQAAATALMGEVWQSAIAWLDASGQVGQWLGVAPTTAAQTKNFGE